MTRELKSTQLVFLLVLVAVAAACLAVLLASLMSGARTATAATSTFGTITLGGTDTIYNWDFDSSSNGVIVSISEGGA